VRRAVGHEFAIIDSIELSQVELYKKAPEQPGVFFRLVFSLHVRMDMRVALAEIEKATRRWLFQTLHSNQAYAWR